MKRLSEGQIKETIAPMSQPHGHPAVLRKVAQAQFQADLEAVKASRENIAVWLYNYLASISIGSSSEHRLELADQIIKILEEE